VGDTTMVLKFFFFLGFLNPVFAPSRVKVFCVSGVWSFRIVVVNSVISTPELCFFFFFFFFFVMV
jgi:hypothetical protein